jgi:CBS domain-containing protein
MSLRDILQAKGHVVHTIGSDATLEDVVQSLVNHNCGSLVVCDHQPSDPSARMIGIITERDILKASASHRGAISSVKVADAMTRAVTTGSLDDTVEATMGLMTDLRIRHLPVMEQGQLVGLISLGDLVKIQYERLTMENHYLKNYLQG